jgi:hypothetical protein
MGPKRRALPPARPHLVCPPSFFDDFPMPDSSRMTGTAVEAHLQFLIWLIPTVEKFPRTRKLGDRIQTTALDVLEALIEATYTRDRRAQLGRANVGIEKLRFFFLLAVDLHLLGRRHYEHSARGLDEIGHLIRHWAKAHATVNAKTTDY